MIDLYYSVFKQPISPTNKPTKQSTKDFSILEKQVSKFTQSYAIAKTLDIPIYNVVIKPIEAPNSEHNLNNDVLQKKSEISKKPYHDNVQFNTSNEAGTVLVAVTKNTEISLGVDLVLLETPIPTNNKPNLTDFDLLDHDYLTQMMITTSELHYITKMATRELRQFVYGCIIAAKEAFLKYHGIGLVGISRFNEIEVFFPTVPDETSLAISKCLSNNLNDEISFLEFPDSTDRITVDFIHQIKPNKKPSFFSSKPAYSTPANALLFRFNDKFSESGSLIGSVVSNSYASVNKLHKVEYPFI